MPLKPLLGPRRGRRRDRRRGRHGPARWVGVGVGEEGGRKKRGVWKQVCGGVRTKDPSGPNYTPLHSAFSPKPVLFAMRRRWVRCPLSVSSMCLSLSCSHTDLFIHRNCQAVPYSMNTLCFIYPSPENRQFSSFLLSCSQQEVSLSVSPHTVTGVGDPRREMAG